MKTLLTASLLTLTTLTTAYAAPARPVYTGTVCQMAFQELHKQRAGGILTIIPMKSDGEKFVSTEVYADANSVGYAPAQPQGFAAYAAKHKLTAWLVISATKDQPIATPMRLQIVVADTTTNKCLGSPPAAESVGSLMPELLPEIYMSYKYYKRPSASYQPLKEDLQRAAYQTPPEQLYTEIRKLIADLK